MLDIVQPQFLRQPFGVFGDQNAERTEPTHRIWRQPDRRLDLGHVLEAGEIADTAEHAQQQPGIGHRDQRRHRVRRHHQLHHFHAHAFARQRVEAVAAGDAGGNALGVRVIAGAVGGVKPEEAQDSQIVFLDALPRHADEMHAPFGEIRKPADIIVDRAVARCRQRVDGKIAPLGVGLPVAAEGNLGVAAVGLDVAAQRGHFERMLVDDHGDGAVVIDKHPFEVTTLRRDVETDGRHAKVAFGRDWKTDAERRDFTINALSASRDGTVYDYVGGLADLAERRVHFIGVPRQRIEEDYLRILRFFRFHAAYGTSDHPYAEGIAACIAGRDGLDALSRERVRMEVMKLVVAPHAVPTLISMADAGLLLRVLGGVGYLAGFENMAKVEAAIGLPPDPVRRLGALGVLIAEDAERLAQKLRLHNVEHERLASMAEGWRRISSGFGEPAARALLYRLGPQAFTDHALLGWARSAASVNDTDWHALATLPQRWTAPVFPLKAADFIRRGVVAGPALGAALRAAEMAWVEADFPADQAATGAIADKATRETAASG